MSTQEHENSDNPELTPEQITVFRRATQSLRGQAAGHADFGVFNLKDQPEDYYQDFRDVYYPPTDNPDLESIDSFCRAIMGKGEDGRSNFDVLRQGFRDNQAALDEARKIIDNGGRVLLITPHKELADIAMVMAAFQCEIGDEELVRRTRIFVGPILKELEINGIDAILALQFSSGIFVGVPDTLNTKKRIESGEIDPKVKKISNNAVDTEFKKQAIAGEISLVATAPSGSTDEETDSGILLKSVSRGTDILARRYFEGVLPVSVIMDKEHTMCVVGKLVNFSKNDSLHTVMENALAPLHERVTGKRTSYEGPEDNGRRSTKSAIGSAALNQPK